MASAVPAPGSGFAGSRVVPGRWIVIFVALVGIGTAVVLGWLARPQPVPPPRPTNLVAAPAAVLWGPLRVNQEPPADILGHVVVPAGVTSATYRNYDGNAAQYDREADFAVAASTSQVVAFYQRQLAALGWHINAVSSARNQPGTQVIATRNSSDSYTWEAVATVTSQGSGSSVALDLQQMSDQG